MEFAELHLKNEPRRDNLTLRLSWPRVDVPDNCQVVLHAGFFIRTVWRVV